MSGPFLAPFWALRGAKSPTGLSPTQYQSECLLQIVGRAGRLRGGSVCEVGPGPGGLTRAIMEHAPRRLVLVEKDGRFVKMLNGLRDAYPQGESYSPIWRHPDSARAQGLPT